MEQYGSTCIAPAMFPEEPIPRRAFFNMKTKMREDAAARKKHLVLPESLTP
jgi:hypothetical protein